MGNRAVITTSQEYYTGGVGIYLHWNGGRDSVEGFLKYCDLRGFRTVQTDSYGWARLVQVIANFMGGDGTSVGIDRCTNLDCDNYDNGVYFIKRWEIVGRQFFRGRYEQQEYPLIDMLKAIDQAQPEDQQLGEQMIQDLLDEGKTIDLGFHGIDWNHPLPCA